MLIGIVNMSLLALVAVVSLVLSWFMWRKCRAVRKQNSQLQQMANAIGELNVMLIFDGDGNLKSLNQAFTKLYGLSEAEYVGKVGAHLSDYIKWSGGKDFDFNREKTSFVGKSIGIGDVCVWKQVTVTRCVNMDGEVSFMAVELDITHVKEAELELQNQKRRSDELLVNMLPSEIVDELKAKGSATPRIYKNASVLFADIKNFTQWAERMNPRELIDTLQELFSDFDDVLARNYIEKIKTIGDAYMCAGGLPMPNHSHPFDIVLAAFGLQNAVRAFDEKRARSGRDPWLMRIGIHTGPVVTGVVGKTRTAYDVWGDSVNTASRLESACEPGKVNISKETYDVIKDYFVCEYRGKIPAKHKGEIDMYFVNRLKPEYSADEEGFIPNSSFQTMRARL